MPKLPKIKPKPKRTLDPANKNMPGRNTVVQSLIGENGKPMRLVGSSLGATIQVGKNYMRFDCWDAIFVEDEPKTVEKARRKLARALRKELELQHQEACDELVEDE